MHWSPIIAHGLFKDKAKDSDCVTKCHKDIAFIFITSSISMTKQKKTWFQKNKETKDNSNYSTFICRFCPKRIHHLDLDVKITFVLF